MIFVDNMLRRTSTLQEDFLTTMKALWGRDSLYTDKSSNTSPKPDGRFCLLVFTIIWFPSFIPKKYTAEAF